MTSEGHPYARFRRSIEAGNPTVALAAAAELRTVSLADALALCRVLAEAGDARYSRAAARWVARFEAELGATLEQMQLAAAALAQLRLDPTSELAIELLKGLLEPNA